VARRRRPSAIVILVNEHIDGSLEACDHVRSACESPKELANNWELAQALEELVPIDPLA